MTNARYALAGLTIGLAACAAPGSGGDSSSNEGWVKAGSGKFDSSVEAVVVDFEFDGEFVTDSSWNTSRELEAQLLYTIGHLNHDDSVGRLDRMDVTNLTTTSEGGRTRVRYRVKMPVAWGDRDNVPATYDLLLPLDVSYDGLETFTAKYKDTCVDAHAHDVDSGSFWYYYRPFRSGCAVDAADAMTTTATLTVSTVNTTGKYPEYHKIWEDDRLEVVAVFGKYEDGATETSDAGISNYNNFIRGVRDQFAGMGMRTIPETLPTNPGVGTPDITFTVPLEDGHVLQIVALLVDNVREAGPAFDARYHDLTPTADLVSYNGHAGLGTNTRALARKGSWVRGQYVIVFMNGCDTYAYIDTALDDAHALVNSDDPTGTKYIDTVVNAMPSYFHQGRRSALAFINGLLDWEEPQTYEQIFAAIDPMQVVIVTGEHDNVYVPGYGETPPEDPDTEWGGMSVSGTVAVGAEDRHETPVLAAGEYQFDLAGSGDADLYVRIGSPPDDELWDCRPYRYGSEETCVVSLGSPSAVHLRVHGYEAADYTLRGTKLR